MLTKITTPITFFETFQTVRARAAMEGSDRRKQRTKEEVNG